VLDSGFGFLGLDMNQHLLVELTQELNYGTNFLQSLESKSEI
jgi:hypothetical protein